ncbi:MAG: hypothetical protein R2789_15025 [Microthrixaceae bacterium]
MGEGSSLDGETTVECGTGWGCFDDREDYGWENGLSTTSSTARTWSSRTSGSSAPTTAAPARWRSGEVKLTPADDAMAAIEDLRKYIEGDVDSIDWKVFLHRGSRHDGGIPTGR